MSGEFITPPQTPINFNENETVMVGINLKKSDES